MDTKADMDGAMVELPGGVPPDSLSRTVLAENVALVPQTPFLTADTVCHSIRYGMKREVSPEEVREAARKASIAADIEQLEGGYQFVLAEGGTNLSGGQRKRIALSCIFLKNPRILILDEVHLRAGQHLRKAHPGRDRENEGGMRHHGSLHRAPPVHPAKLRRDHRHGQGLHRAAGRLPRAGKRAGLFRDMALGIRK